MDPAAGVRGIGIEDQFPKGNSRLQFKINRRLERDGLAGGGVRESKLGGVQVQARGRRAIIEPVTEYGKTLVSRMNTNLVRSAGEGDRFDDTPVLRCCQHAKTGFGPSSARHRGAAVITFANTDEMRSDGQLRARWNSIGPKDVTFFDLPGGELFRQGSIRERGLAEEQDA